MSSFRGKFLEAYQGKNKARGYNDRQILAQMPQNFDDLFRQTRSRIALFHILKLSLLREQ